jgi:hypothetical protein
MTDLENALDVVEPAPAPRDRWLNPDMSPAAPRAHEAVTQVVRAIEGHGRKRALRAEDRQTLHKVLIPLLSNMIHHYLCESAGEGIPVPRSKRDGALGGKPSRYQPFVFPRSFPKTLDALCELGFAEQNIGGEFSRGIKKIKRTTVRAGPKLIELIKQHAVSLEDLKIVGDTDEIIILRRPKRGHFDEGERIDYRDDATTRRYRQELRGFNEWLAGADIEFDASTYNRPVDVWARRLYRSFTMGRFDSGGRHFGGFWENLPKDVRLRGLSIEGEYVIGLDYSQLNPRLAYSLAKAEPPSGDAYTLPGLEDCRSGVKKVFNAMLFDEDLRSQFPKGVRKLFPRRVKIADVTGAILERHPRLRSVLSVSAIGHTLQFIESEIMMAVLKQCHIHGIVALPVFDCAVVKASAAETVKEIMQQQFKAAAGLDIEVREEADATLL